MKIHTTLSVDNEVLRKAKEKGLTISETLENALIDKLNFVKVEIDNSMDKCDFCGKEEKKATRDNLIGLTWLFPDERWICDACLTSKKRSVIAGARY